ncbi:MAG: methionine--tRNA ligase [Planctomycetes bacterium]|nr:methionine--tRNA ligase [Planctomycetota bacterium]
MAERRYLVTAALPYSNGRLHVGHIAGAYLPSDTYVRFLRARGHEVRYICGSDDNGVANLIAAHNEDTTPEIISARYNAGQQRDFAGLGIEFDIYGGTHQPEYVELHNRISQQMFLTLHEKGCFVKRTTKQLYDPQIEKFLPDRYVKGRCYHKLPDGTECEYPGAYGDQCEHCGKSIDPLLLINPVSTITGASPIPKETTHWYLRLDEFRDRLREWLATHADWRPTVLNFTRGLLDEGLPERAMTRDLDWGVPVPLDDPDAAGKALYVWFDAPIGYVSFTAKHCENDTGDPEGYARWWKDPDCRIVHFIGEDNIIFHALIWPAMLMAEGSFQLPANVVANSFLNIKFPGKHEEKISKSRGAAIWIEDYLNTFDPDPLRYYLTAIAPEAQRTTFDVDDFLKRNNTELLNALGNFVNRTVTFTHKYFDGRVPESGQRDDSDREQLAACGRCVEETARLLEACQFKAALGEVMSLARLGNGYFDATAPFRSRKTDLPAAGRAINVCLQTVRTLTTVMAPFLPFSADKCLVMLGLDADALQWHRATDELAAGTPLGQAQLLFKKLDPVELFDK